MAIYHCSLKIISRGAGKSVVAAAAYRAGEEITNEYDGITHDYTRKGGVVHTEILLPECAPKEYAGRSVLWNAVEKIEKAKNSQLAREIELALPVELSQTQNIFLVRKYVNENFVSKGMCADICIHDKKDGNPHAHIMLTMRPFEKDGSWGAKSRKEYLLDDNGERIVNKNGTFKTWKVDLVDWNEPTKAEEWRAAWASAVNAALDRQGREERVDHRSYERQGKEQIPIVHMGVAASQMEQRGIVTELGSRNREITGQNRLLHRIVERITQLKDWLKEAFVPKAPTTFVNVLRDILENGEPYDRYGRFRDLEAVERIYTFMRENDISTLPELQEKVSEINERLDSARFHMQLTEQRLKTLDENIGQGKIYTQHRELYAQYQKLRPRKKAKFYAAHRAELMRFEHVERYLNGQFALQNIPMERRLKSWAEEREKLPYELSKTVREFKELRAQAWGADTIRYEAEQIVREIKQPKDRLQEKQPPQRGYER